jgi:hypothetical protein
VREKLGIGEMIKWKPSDLPMTTFHDDMKKEIAKQRKREHTKTVAAERNKFQANEQEHKIRNSLLEAFNKEDREKSKSK